MGLPYRWLIHLNKGHFHFQPPPDDPVAFARWEFTEGKKVWERWFSDRVNIESKDVIDLGCGPGGKTCYFATHKPNKIVGVDNAPKLIRQAELARSVLIPPADRHRAEFAVADVSDLPFPEHYFDIAICLEAFNHFPEPAKVLSEAARVLKPGGILCIDFAQFYSHNGHHLGDFFRTPWLHVFWSRDDIEKAVRMFSGSERRKALGLQYPDLLDDLVESKMDLWRNGLNRLSIRKFERLLRAERGLKLQWKARTVINALVWLWIFVPSLRELAVKKNVYILEKV